MVTTNDLLGRLVQATWSSGFVEHVAFEERDGMGLVCVVGPLADLLARIGPEHIEERQGLVVWFRRTAGFKRIVSAVADALERATEDGPWGSLADVD